MGGRGRGQGYVVTWPDRGVRGRGSAMTARVHAHKSQSPPENRLMEKLCAERLSRYEPRIRLSKAATSDSNITQILAGV